MASVAKDSILELLFTPRYRYKGVPVSAFFLPAFGPYKPKTIRNSLSVLSKNGYIKKGSNGHFYVTTEAEKYKNLRRQFVFFDSPFSKNAPKNLLLMFDIPETKKAERNWLRAHLRKFGYVMIQKSVWVGPAPLPKEFRDYTKHIGLKETIKQFKLARSYGK